ncbi:polysaccharide deacetylase family protein [Geotalea sp. SG265]|uniref:polysaccharide deacetylase family protein n=1 Tax=Geotalea sp. SG265 TaxID=2922867 RepID=UPI001FAEB405
MHNVLTIDVEDWYHVCNHDGKPVVPQGPKQVRPNVERILTLLAEYDVKATFFMLGSVAEEEPALTGDIVNAGHEIASHGYSHTLVPLLGPDKFRDELRRTAEIIGHQTGCRPMGFRAPQWSVNGNTPWALDILHEEGYRYDSSCNPLPFVGDPRGARNPYSIATSGGAIIEVPPMVTPSLFGNLPTGGGWGFRFFPLGVIVRTARTLNQAGKPAVFYLHPREMDPSGPRLDLPALQAFAAYGTRTDAEGRLRHLLQTFRFCTMKQLVETWEVA